jgi:membrane protein DedA with SNARE-associated domain
MMLVLEPEATTPARPGGRRRLLLLVVPIVALVIASNVGDALTTTWADRHPLALVMLNARNRVLILTTNQLDAGSYYVAATFRLLLSDPLFFLLGMWYGDAAVRWAERKSPSYGGMLRTFERWFGRASYPLVFIAPNNFICLFAGAAGMRVSVFVVLNVTGTLARLYAIRWLGDAFQRPIDAVLHFFARYRLLLLVLSVAFVAFTVWNDSRRGRGDLDAALELESELEGEEE